MHDGAHVAELVYLTADDVAKLSSPVPLRALACLAVVHLFTCVFIYMLLLLNDCDACVLLVGVGLNMQLRYVAESPN